jgi:hypothetical protein
MTKSKDSKNHGRFKLEPLKLKNIQNNLDFEMNDYNHGANEAQAADQSFANSPPLMKFDDIISSAHLDQTPMTNQGKSGRDFPPRLNMPDTPGNMPGLVKS